MLVLPTSFRYRWIVLVLFFLLVACGGPDSSIPEQARLTVTVEGQGLVTSSVEGIDCGDTCVADFDRGSSITLTATPGEGWEFVEWQGGCTGSATTCTLTMIGPRNVTVLFAEAAGGTPPELDMHQITVIREGRGSGTVTSSPSGIDCDASGEGCSATFEEGTTVTLTAHPSSASVFAGWQDCDSTSENQCIVTVNSDRSVTVTFTETMHDLNVQKTGSGSGTVTSTPSGIDCGEDCTASFPEGTTVTLTATPDEGSVFSSWTEGCEGTDGNQCAVIMSEATTVQARFSLPPEPGRRTLSVNKEGSGRGTVTSEPAGIDCGDACSADFTENTTVTLTAEPMNGSTFEGWEECDSTEGNQCTVSMNDSRSVTARFSRITHTLTVTKEGSGSGTVTSSPSGIDCGDDCEQAFQESHLVTLTATPAEGSVFTGWGGDCESTNESTCSVTMDRRKNVTATFETVTPPSINAFSARADLVLENEGLEFAWDIGNPEGGTVSCSLDPGDGSPPLEVDDCERDKTTTHVFTTGGRFTSTLTVTDVHGNSRSAEVPVVVMANLAPEDLESVQNFGYSIAISEDVMVVGAPGQGEAVVGKAYIYTRSGEQWQLQQELQASDAKPGDRFGIAVVIEEDTMVVGANSGEQTDYLYPPAAYVFTRSGSTWEEQQKLTPSDISSGLYGVNLGISDDTLVIGTPSDDGMDGNYGRVYIYAREGTSWEEQQILLSPVAEDPPAVPDIGLYEFGWAVAVQDDMLVVGANAETVYTYTREDTVWTLQQQLVPFGGVSINTYGAGVWLQDEVLVVGAYDRHQARSFFTYTRFQEGWRAADVITEADGFTPAVALTNDVLTIGGIDTLDLYAWNGATWEHQQSVRTSQEHMFTAIDGDDDTLGFANPAGTSTDGHFAFASALKLDMFSGVGAD